MAFYKLCDCGTKNMFEHRGLAPRKCEKCGRSLLEVSVVDEELVEEQEEITDEKTSEDISLDRFYYSLNTPDGKEQIVIPSSGGIVGRNALGAELLGKHNAVSREHIKVSYRGRIGLLIEDISQNQIKSCVEAISQVTCPFSTIMSRFLVMNFKKQSMKSVI